MLFAAAFECEIPATLIVGRLKPKMFEIVHPAPIPRPIPVPALRMIDAETAKDLQTVREALADGRYPEERAIDCVVDRLLEELTW